MDGMDEWVRRVRLQGRREKKKSGCSNTGKTKAELDRRRWYKTCTILRNGQAGCNCKEGLSEGIEEA